MPAEASEHDDGAHPAQKSEGEAEPPAASEASGRSSQEGSAPPSRSKSRNAPRKSNSRASIRSRDTPPPKLRRRESKEKEVSGGSENEADEDESKGPSTGGAETAPTDEPLQPAVSGIVEETPSAIQLLEKNSQGSAGQMATGSQEGKTNSTPAVAIPSVTSMERTSLSGVAAERTAEPELKASSPNPVPTQGHLQASPLDALPSSPTRSRVSASVAEPSSSTKQLQDGGKARSPTSPRFMSRGAEPPPAQSHTVPKSRQRAGVSVAVAKTTSQTAKERPLIQAAHSKRFEAPPPPEPDDSLSETKTAVIRRVQEQLQHWESQLDHIQAGRQQSDKLHKHELQKREMLVRELKVQTDEQEKQRKILDEERARLAEHLMVTSDNLVDREAMLERTQDELKQVEDAYQDMEEQKLDLDNQVAQLSEDLEHNEALRRRLNEQVTQLQGQLAIEEQRSKVCLIL